MAYHSSVEDKENPLAASVDKMHIFRPRWHISVSKQELKVNLAEMVKDRAEMNHKVKKLGALRQGHLELRQKVLSTNAFEDIMGIPSQIYEMPRKVKFAEWESKNPEIFRQVWSWYHKNNASFTLRFAYAGHGTVHVET
ncbi:hypothetical protein N7474_000616 [Penicillium riverlandense]|uniref:uncharacterized protein n=1 Tax=Penicillium riverlandense TaxID=1903569 RepID=UPI002548EA6B|nr:uncharacterized protein N7474_000616 [Penicillium riverlandense]KAJ5832305.1 hypothetical protein N7474_000616 [Penicillium riverlandense]